MCRTKKLEATRDTRRGLFAEGWAMSRVSRAASVLMFTVFLKQLWAGLRRHCFGVCRKEIQYAAYYGPIKAMAIETSSDRLRYPASPCGSATLHRKRLAPQQAKQCAALWNAPLCRSATEAEGVLSDSDLRLEDFRNRQVQWFCIVPKKTGAELRFRAEPEEARRL